MRKWIPLAVIFLAIITQSLAAFQSPPHLEQPTQAILLLKEPSVAERLAQEFRGEPALLRRLRQEEDFSEQRRAVEQSQLELLERLSRLGLLAPSPQAPLRLLARRSFLLNMLVVEGSPRALEELAADPEIRGVYPNPERHLLLDAAVPLIGAPALWQLLGGKDQAGAGIKIGIIDSGILLGHPMFRPDGLSMPAGFPKGQAAFTNAKVIAARTYVSPEFGLRDQADKTPADERGHGTQVAGVAAGRETVSTATGQTISGVAPMAWLGNYKVFGQPGINDVTSSAAVLAALNDAVQDGMDVVNLSLGGSPRDPQTDPEQLAIANAVSLGVVVVIAAGNSGPANSTILSPGTSPAAITVGASTNPRVFASALELTSEHPDFPEELANIPFTPSTAEPIREAIGPLPLLSVAELDATELACSNAEGASPFPPDSLKGVVALIRRGTCTFREKVDNALGAGAEGVIVYNHLEGPRVIMANLEGIARPAVFIDRAPGEALRDFLLGSSGSTTLDQRNVQVTFQPECFPVESPGDVLSSFSSRGPNPTNASEIKPDLVAPGQNIHTATKLANSSATDEFNKSANGTSFSTPMVSGAAALILQQHPEWKEKLSPDKVSKAVKSALVNLAFSGVRAGERPARVMEAGNGRLDLSRALEANCLLDPVSVSFGTQTENRQQQLTRVMKLTNLGDQRQTFQLSVRPQVQIPGVQVRVSPTSLTLDPLQEGSFQVVATFSPPVSAGTFEGRIDITAGNLGMSAAYWGAAVVEDSGGLILVSQQGGDVSSLENALAIAKPGNTIEITDEATYTVSLNIDTNQDGLPLNGITLRARQGKSPTLQGASPTSPVITVSELERVVIEGLHIRGGLNSIRFQNSSGVIRNNLLEQTSANTTAHGISLINSRAHIYGNILREISASGIAAFTSPVLIQGNQIGSLEKGNGENGVFVSAGSEAGIFDNRIANNGNLRDGQGVRVSNTSVLVKGNLIEQNKGSLGDGVLLNGLLARGWIQDNIIRGNQRRGVAVLTQAQGVMRRNRVENNRDAGLYLLDSSQAEGASNLFSRNDKNIQLFNSSQLNLSDSVLIGSTSSLAGHGLLAQDSTFQLVNCTLTENNGFGVRSINSSAQLHNCIFFSNGNGDLSGVGSSQVFNSLIGDGQFSGVNGNFGGDPLFFDPSQQDYSPLAGSPVIDRGDSRAPFSEEDLLSHVRIWDGDGDGEAKVDVGAVEFGADHAPPLILPLVSNPQSDFVGLALANVFPDPEALGGPAGLTHQEEAVKLRAYTPQGDLLREIERAVPRGTQFSSLVKELFPDLPEGWLEIAPPNPDVMSFTLAGTDQLNRMDGAELSRPQARRLLFPEVHNGEGRQTWYYLVNVHPLSLQVTFIWVDPSGSAQQVVREIPARGSLRVTFQELFGGGQGGYLRAEADLPLYGLQLFGSSQSLGGLLGQDWEGGTSLLFAAQFASNQSVETFLNVVNAGPASDITFELFNDAGELVKAVTIPQVPSGGQIESGGQELFSLAGSSAVGWVRIQAGLGTRLLGSIRFGDPQERFLASLPLRAQGARESLLSHVAVTPQVFTGVTLLNPNPKAVLVTLEVFDRLGNLTGIAFLFLGANQKQARLLNEWVPELANQSGGFIRIRSNLPILSFELFGSSGLDFLSAVPQQVVVP